MIEREADKNNKIHNNSLINKKLNLSELNSNNSNNDDYSEINKSIISKDTKKLELLLKSGKNPNVCGLFGETPIFTCINLNNVESLLVLLKYGAKNLAKNAKIKPKKIQQQKMN